MAGTFVRPTTPAPMFGRFRNPPTLTVPLNNALMHYSGRGYQPPQFRDAITRNPANPGQGYITLQHADGSLAVIGFAPASDAAPTVLLRQAEANIDTLGFKLGALAQLLDAPASHPSIVAPMPGHPMSYDVAVASVEQRIAMEKEARNPDIGMHRLWQHKPVREEYTPFPVHPKAAIEREYTAYSTRNSYVTLLHYPSSVASRTSNFMLRIETSGRDATTITLPMSTRPGEEQARKIIDYMRQLQGTVQWQELNRRIDVNVPPTADALVEALEVYLRLSRSAQAPSQTSNAMAFAALPDDLAARMPVAASEAAVIASAPRVTSARALG